MTRQAFAFSAPRSVAEAVKLLAESGPDAKLLAGGQSLVPALNLGLATPSHIISLNRLRPALSYVKEEGAELAVGALTTHHALATSTLVRQTCPILAEAAGSIGDVQVRHRGTIGGSLAHCDPAADYPPVCFALGARFRLVGAGGERIVHVDDFFQGYMTTAVAPDEILTEVRVPRSPAGTGSAYAKLRRVEGGFAIVGVAAVLTVRDGRCESIAVGISGGGAVPFRLRGIEARLRGKSVDQQFIAEAAEAAYAAATEPSSELHADAAYKRAMVRAFTRRALRSAAERATR